MNMYPKRGVFMDIGAVDPNAIYSAIEAQQFETKYAAKLIEMARQSEAVVGSLIEDTVEFSQEAMQKFLSERI